MQQYKLTQLDMDQCTKRTFDETNWATRVVLVGGENLTINADVKQSENQKIQVIEVPVIVKEVEYKEIQVPQIIEKVEYRTIEVPVLIKETEYKEIIKEVIVEVPKFEVITIEKPVIVVEYRDVHIPFVIEKYKQFPMIVKICIVLQSLALIGLLIKH